MLKIYFFSVTIAAAVPVSLTLLFLPREQNSLNKLLVFIEKKFVKESKFTSVKNMIWFVFGQNGGQFCFLQEQVISMLFPELVVKSDAISKL